MNTQSIPEFGIWLLQSVLLRHSKLAGRRDEARRLGWQRELEQ